MAHAELPVPRLELPEEALQERFDRLQEALVPLWKSISHLNQEDQTIVVVPSVSLDFALRPSEMQAYEERLLFLLLLLRQPRARMVYVTGQPVPESVIDYYLALLPGLVPSHARARLFMLAVGDGDPIPLTHKVLQRPRLIERIRGLVADPGRAHLVPFNTTWAERDLALRLGIPMYGNDPRHEHLGSKSGSRRLFKEAGVPCPAGFEDLGSLDDIVSGIVELKKSRPQCPAAIVKLDASVSGEGNAQVDLTGASPEPAAIEQRVMEMTTEMVGLSADDYLAKFARIGGIVEERIVADGVLSPSVQLRITPLGEVQLLSTHDQLLGGPTGLSFLGARFPADDAYASMISQEALKIGTLVARAGVIGRFAVDFLTAKQDGDWHAWAIEVNLRKGGTTHPFLTLQFLTDGEYDWKTNVFRTRGGQPKCLVASDHMESEDYRVLEIDDLFDAMVANRLHFDHSRQRGVVLHMLACLGDCGRFGLTAVGDSAEDAETLYREAEDALLEAARAARLDRGLPSDSDRT